MSRTRCAGLLLALAASSACAADGAAAGNPNAFNPAISLILSGLYTRTSQDPANYAINGAPLTPDAEVGPGTRGFSLAETELGFSASVDPFWRGAANISLHPDDTASVEEAFVQTTALGEGFGLKMGRFFSAVGYLNAQHAHTWDFVDAPLAYQAFLGGQYGDDGVQLTWLAPTDLFVELGAELARGRTFPGGDDSRNGAGMSALTAHLGGDVGTSHSWRAGVSVLSAKAGAQDLQWTDRAGSVQSATFDGRTRVWVADAVWKWAPEGNATRTNFKLQGEWLRSTRSGSLSDGSDAASTRNGGYVQAVWQFMPRWRVGARTERLSQVDDVFTSEGGAAKRQSLMVDWSPSEFSRIRLQVADDRARPDGTRDRQLFLQYQMSLGAHGAHAF